MSLGRIRCFFDIEIDSVPLGRIIFELFNDSCPKTCENFRALCTGELGSGKTTGKALHYRNVKFHRVIKDFMVQAGDFSAGNGTGGESIYGGQFEDENFDMTHDTPFLLSMANRGPDTNGSQFFITTQTASHLDGKHVVFGRVISGQEVVVSIESLPVDNRSRPLQQAVISNCGELILQTGQLRTKEKKKKKRRVDDDVEQESEKKKKKKKEKKHKHKKDKHSDSDEENDQKKNPVKIEAEGGAIVASKVVSTKTAPLFKSHPLVSISTINPEEIPEVPKNRFLDRGFQNQEREDGREAQHQGRLKSKANVRFFTRSGRKVKGRGLLRYRTPSRSRSRSRSATPPHWRQAQRRTVTYERYQREAEEQEYRERRREERHRLQEGDEETGGGESRMRGRIVVGEGGFGMMEGEDEDGRRGSNRDWRVARQETFEDKENRGKGADFRQKLKDKLGIKCFIKGTTLNKREHKAEDKLDLDDTALDYEAPSDNEEMEEEEEADEEEEMKRDKHRDRERSRGNKEREREERGSERTGRNRGERESDRRGGDRKGRDKRRDSRERKSDRHRSSGRHRERGGGSDRTRRRSGSHGGSH